VLGEDFGRKEERNIVHRTMYPALVCSQNNVPRILILYKDYKESRWLRSTDFRMLLRMFVVYLHPCFLVVLEQGQALEMNVMQNGQMAIYSLIGQERIGEVAEIERARERVRERESVRERARERERERERKKRE
jgi:hypothetical protein